ncbi:sialate O-acetylesterase [Pontibacter ruber]|uniref:Sialate O-acetylesterase n=1 Tax=Pontibacter ruber TaxID=1343895 RepID=A0ABW5D2R9_9BACT|nr:sialate O-acetylesterase [Pontibacter ruber]
MIKYYTILLQILSGFLLLASCAEKDEESPANAAPVPDNAVDVHVIIGQSNSTGMAHIYELPEDMLKPLEGCYIYNKDNGKFEIMQAGVNTQTGKDQFGPVLKAAQLLQAHKKKDVYFVVAGTGGTQLYKSGTSAVQDWHPESNEIFAQATQTIDKARKALEADGKQPVFKSIAWWQGEFDAQYQEKAADYQANEQALFAALDQVAYLSSTRRVVYRVFSDVEDMPYAQDVNDAKAKRAAADKRTTLIQTDGYPRIPKDPIHASDQGLLQAGTDWFNAIKNL